MTEDLPDRITRLALKTRFAEVAEQSLNELLGESGATAAIYHMGARTLQNPQVFEEKIKVIFGLGAEIILEHILGNMETSSQT